MSKAKNYGDLLAMGVVRRPHPPRLAGRGARSPLFLLLRKPVRLGPGVVMRQKRHEWDNLVAGHNGTARGEGTARRNRFRPDCRSGSVTSEYITCVSPNPRRQECCVERESAARLSATLFFFHLSFHAGGLGVPTRQEKPTISLVIVQIRHTLMRIISLVAHTVKPSFPCGCHGRSPGRPACWWYLASRDIVAPPATRLWRLRREQAASRRGNNTTVS